MIIELRPDAPTVSIETIRQEGLGRGLAVQAMTNERGGTVIGVGGALPFERLDLPGVVRIEGAHKPYMLASREMRGDTVVMLGDVAIGGADPVIMAGPCVIEDRDSLVENARLIQRNGATVLRGGAFKPRTSPYSFQGLGEEGLRHLAAAREATGMPVVTEVMEPEQVDMVSDYADMLQIGSRNMANFPLLKRVGHSRRPVLLKRGFSATMEEFLMSAEYIMAHGNPNVVLCERGIRAFDSAFRFSLDLNVVPALRELTHLPIVVDPSHGTGRRSLVARMAMAGMAAGADGIIVEVHPDPDSAMCDASQTITPATLAQIHRGIEALRLALDPIFAPPVTADRLVAVAD